MTIDQKNIDRRSNLVSVNELLHSGESGTRELIELLRHLRRVGLLTVKFRHN